MTNMKATCMFCVKQQYHKAINGKTVNDLKLININVGF